MAASVRPMRSHRWRLLIAWLCTASIVGVYFSLPDGDDGLGVPIAHQATDTPIPVRVEVVAVTPADATPGSAVTVQFAGARHPETLRAYLGKTELTVLSRLEDALVVRLPSSIVPGHLKLRVSDGD